MTTPGTLWLVPNTLDLGTPEAASADLRAVLPQGVLDTAARLGHWVCENAKTTRAFLKRVDAVVPLAQPLQALDIRELPRPPKGRAAAAEVDLRPLLAPALAGHDLGLISEAGLPAVADPGAALVAAGLGIAQWSRRSRAQPASAAWSADRCSTSPPTSGTWRGRSRRPIARASPRRAA